MLKLSNPKIVLVVDDEPSSLELIDFILKKHHFQTILVGEANQALKVTEKQVPDLILLDLLMPDMNGAELCKRFKTNPLTQNVPILFISAIVSDKEIVKGFKAGAVGYIFKPFDSDRVIKKVEEILKVKRE